MIDLGTRMKSLGLNITAEYVRNESIQANYGYEYEVGMFLDLAN